MHNEAFSAPFAAALSATIGMFEIPADGKFEQQRVMNILTYLQNNITDRFKTVHDHLEKEAKKNKESPTKWQVVSDSVRRYVLGNYQRDVIPSYIRCSIDKLPDKRWASFFMQTLVVKHNHLTVSRALSSDCPRNVMPLLMDLQGKLLTDKVTEKPYSPEFFDVSMKIC